jgi:hypothetical protein
MENSTISNFRNELILRKKNPIHFGNVETDPRLLWYTLTFSMRISRLEGRVKT